MFLPDRFIKGECPKCHSQDQYGDSCEVCSATYDPTDLINPKSVVTGSTPITKESEHFFFNLPDFTDMLKKWVSDGHLQSEISHKLAEWFEAGLRPWDITRDEPYFGFKIPGTDNKYFYVWLDAPIGYMASFKKLCADNPDINFDDYWKPNNNTKLIHFIGKDITYFHALFWPAVLEASGHKKPDQIYVNGFLTVNGKKMSKSRGTFILARTYLDHLDSEYLRYYFAAKLGHQVEDLDLNLEDFVQRVNSDLVGKLVNIASRCSGFITKKFDKKLADNLELNQTTTDNLNNPDNINTDFVNLSELYNNFISKSDSIIKHYQNIEYSTAIREIMALADKANQFIDFYKPWVLIKEDNQISQDTAHKVCTMGINLYRVLISYLSPVLPKLASKSSEFLNASTDNWQNLDKPLLSHEINKFKPLLQRIDPDKIKDIISASTE